MTCIDMQVFPAMAPPQVGFQTDPIESPFHIQLPTAVSPDEVYAAADTATATATAAAVEECVGEQQRRLRRRISNRESARRSRDRKQRYVDELWDGAALLERWNRELASRVQDAHGRLALVRLANARLRAEAAARSASVVCTTLPRPLWRPAAATGSGACCCLRFVDIEQTTGNSAREIDGSHEPYPYVAHDMELARAAPCLIGELTVNEMQWTSS